MVRDRFQEMEKRALASGNVRDCEYVARHYEGADVAALEARVLECGTPFEWTSFAIYVDRADVAKIQAHLLAHGAPMDWYLFARDVHKPEVDIALLQERVARSGMGGVRRFFAANIPGADPELLRATREPETPDEVFSVAPGF